MTRRPWCCFIAVDETECRRLARWEAWWHENGDPYINTHACDAHLGKLIPDDGREVHVGALEVQAIDALADLVAES